MTVDHTSLDDTAEDGDPRYLAPWVARVGYQPGSREANDAGMVLGWIRPEPSEHTQILVLDAAGVLAGQQVDTLTVTPVQALALTVEMYNAGVLDLHHVAAGDDTAGAALANTVRTKVTRVIGYDSETGATDLSDQAAAWEAVTQLGGPDVVPIRPWMAAALRDTEYPVGQQMLNYVRRATHSVAPGRSWRHVYGVGTVVYEGTH